MMQNSSCVSLAAALSLLAAPAVLFAGPAAPQPQPEPIPFLLCPDAAEAQTQSFFVRIGIYEYTTQYAFGLLGVDDAHQYATGNNIVVAVLDTGVSTAHDMLEGRVASGYNFVEDSDDTSDSPDGVDNDGDGDIDEFTGHGTWTAGIIAAVAPDATILPVTVLNSDGVGNAKNIASGIYYAMAEGADIIHLSVATTANNKKLADAVADAYKAGVLVIASVANNNSQQPVYPAAYNGVYAVAATDENDIKASFSGYGSFVDLSAPGVDVAGPLPDNEYGLASGASGAAAWVTGAAALLLEHATTNDPLAYVSEVFGSTAVDISAQNPGYTGLLGAGRLDIEAAAAMAASTPPASAFATNYNLTMTVNEGALEVVSYLDQWFAGAPTAELTGDSVVDQLDLVVFLDLWFNAP